MKSKFLLLLFVILFLSTTQAQNYWVRGFGGANVDESLDLDVDLNGNVISTGYFTGTCNFGGIYSFSSLSSGTSDIFVQKISPSGNVIWAVSAGGSGSDRATSIKTDQNGNTYITGFYQGTAQFGSISLSSAGGSQDVFIAKLNTAGVFQWAVSGGGIKGDYAYDLCLDQNDGVYITGEFEGDATFGGQTISSAINPTTSLPSFDVFIAKYNNSGNFIWLKQGAAEKNDRGLALACDSLNNLFVTGQFSDTITFQNTYNNPITNAIFLLKYDSAGNELWFKKIAGSYGIAYSLEIDHNQNIVMCGDYKGTLTFIGSPNHFLNDTKPNRIFLAKLSNNGNYLWATSDASDNGLSARTLSIAPNNEIYLAGEFNCKMTEYSDIYGNAAFNSVGYTDIFTCKFSDTGIRIWEKHFGGPGKDKVHCIKEGTYGRPLICGGFEHYLNWPKANTTFDIYPTNNINSGSAAPYCGDNYYGQYATVEGNGLSDGFVCDAMDLSRLPYDFYVRNGTVCDRNPLDICLGQVTGSTCSDTLFICDQAELACNTQQILPGIVAPLYHYDWSFPGSNDSTTTIEVNTSGNYSVKLTSYDGCYNFEDTVYVYVDPLIPLISDDHGVNTQSGLYADYVFTCAPDIVELTTTSSGSGSYTLDWTNQIPNDSITQVSGSGIYFAYLNTNNGCNKMNKIVVNIIQQLNLYSAMPDTFEICAKEHIIYQISDSTLNTCPYCYCYTQHNISANDTSLHASISSCDLQITFSPTMSGDFIFTDTISSTQNGCTETVVFVDTFHIIVNPLPIVNLNLSGQSPICPGDTSLLVAIASDTVHWNTGLVDDTLYTSMEGIYSATVSTTDYNTGCNTTITDTIHVDYIPEPVILSFPSTALICPADSVRLETDISNANNYTWFGPMGVIQGNSASVFTNIPGIYYCTVIDPSGCVLTSITKEVKQYSTPYLVGDPVTTLCPNDSTIINVIADETATINWLAPFSGTDISQNVDTGGIYYCDVTSCGITTNCQIEIIQGHPNTDITISGNLHFCPGDSVVLTADSSMTYVSWMPNGESTTSLPIYYQGTYWLSVVDQYGCMLESDSVTVTWDTSVVSPVVTGDTICIGSTALLTASASGGPIEWYPSFPSNTLLSANDTFLVSGLDSNAIYYATTYDTTGCHSVWIPISVVLYQDSFIPDILTDTLACLNENIQLSTPGINGASYLWTGPGNYSSTNQNPVIASAGIQNSGLYNLIVVGGGCTSLPAQIEIDLIEPSAVSVTGQTTICENDSLILQVGSTNTNVAYMLSINGATPITISGNQYIAQNMQPGLSTLNFFENYLGCNGPNENVAVTVKPRPWLDSVGSNLPVCAGDTLKLQVPAYTNANYFWNGPNQFSGSNNELIFSNVDTTLNGMYTVVADLNGCIGDSVMINVSIFPGINLYLGNDTTVCIEDGYILNPGNSYFSYEWNTGSNHYTLPIDTSGMYILYVTNSFGCHATDTVNITVITCDPQLTNVFTPNGDGVNDVFRFAGDNLQSVECIISDRWGRVIYKWSGPEGYWDGRTILNEPSKEGVYYYTGKLVSYKGEETILNGFVHLAR